MPNETHTEALLAGRRRRSVVIGATGFIGGWVARALASRGDALLLVARDLEALRRQWPGAVLSPEAPGERAVAPTVSVAAGDARTIDSMERHLLAFGGDTIFNLVGYGVDRAERDEGLAMAINRDFPVALAELAGSWGACLVHAGSALEYGTAHGDLREDTVPMATTRYGITKLAGTEGVRAVALRRASRAVTARLFTVYGAGEHAGRLLPSIVDLGAGDAPIPLSAGTQRRDFTYVADVVEGLLRLADAHPEPGEPVNLCTGRLHTVREFAEAAADALGIARARLAFGAIPTRPEEMAHDAVSIARLQRLTGWHPDPSLDAGVRRAVAALRAAAPFA
ncbi:MAG: NAD(P)-dependent oxidoreductase [Gemmatimonadaceae bacterium]|nr:NAD(P)-dependent oxidoreductase [Gemmatimonadaceae bacterium]